MSKKENLTENLRIRVTPAEKSIIAGIAQAEGISYSEAIRHSIFSADTASSLAIRIQRNLIKHEYRNRIMAMKLPKKTKEKLIKELADIG